ncbi:MAG: hypothetical protein UT42_C0051G0001 [Candidatus Falkowbacteria bacterium GW2011_GWA2_39_24]|uniref:Uncharacterized protein n=1 Tax=Candidatus Falkowbacteria bacterium GW2011_GWA2_39_24 TaxID=1618634 RepID=A0A0G0NK46_9BACT|nr:MAG: hypothetical protein UT42_C0051G0001 [Candidatus Falkowbacteria bacterium GW2011_GWA2_39_24]
MNQIMNRKPRFIGWNIAMIIIGIVILAVVVVLFFLGVIPEYKIMKYYNPIFMGLIAIFTVGNIVSLFIANHLWAIYEETHGVMNSRISQLSDNALKIISAKPWNALFNNSRNNERISIHSAQPITVDTKTWLLFTASYDNYKKEMNPEEANRVARRNNVVISSGGSFYTQEQQICSQ